MLLLLSSSRIESKKLAQVSRLSRQRIKRATCVVIVVAVAAVVFCTLGRRRRRSRRRRRLGRSHCSAPSGAPLESAARL